MEALPLDGRRVNDMFLDVITNISRVFISLAGLSLFSIVLQFFADRFDSWVQESNRSNQPSFPRNNEISETISRAADWHEPVCFHRGVPVVGVARY